MNVLELTELLPGWLPIGLIPDLEEEIPRWARTEHPPAWLPFDDYEDCTETVFTITREAYERGERP